MKQNVIILIVLALGVCSISISAQTKKQTPVKKTKVCIPKNSKEYRVEMDGFEWYKVRKDGKVGAEDRNGKVLVPCEYDDVGYNNSAAVDGVPSGFWAYKSKYKGWYDYDGKCIIPYTRKYTNIFKYKRDYFGIYYECEKENHVILCDINGKEVCSVPFDLNKITAVTPMFDSNYNVFYFVLHYGRDDLYAIADGNGIIVSGPDKESTNIGVCCSLVTTNINPLADNIFKATQSNNKNDSDSKTSTVVVEHKRDPVPVQEWVQCTACWGSTICPNCAGSGTVYVGSNLHRCSRCGGRKICTSCSGKGGRYYTVYK